MIAVSESAKSFVQKMTSTFGGPSKTKDYLSLSEREAVDSLVEFARANREGSQDVENPETGEIETIPLDLLALEVERTLAMRAATVRANTATAKLEAKEKELEELRALLAKLQGVS